MVHCVRWRAYAVCVGAAAGGHGARCQVAYRARQRAEREAAEREAAEGRAAEGGREGGAGGAGGGDSSDALKAWAAEVAERRRRETKLRPGE